MIKMCFILITLPMLAGAGIIVQGCAFGEDYGCFLMQFSEGETLNAVEVSGIYAWASWSVSYGFTGAEGVQLDPPARIVTSGYGGFLTFAVPSFTTPEVTCELLISETVSFGYTSCQATAEGGTYYLDPSQWYGTEWVYPGDSTGGATASCVPGSPAIECYAGSEHVYAGGGFTFTYYYGQDYPANAIPEPHSAALVVLPLAVIALAICCIHRRPAVHLPN